MDAIVGLGSNLGSREAMVCVAARLLGALPSVELRALSRPYLTAPLGPAQPELALAQARQNNRGVCERGARAGGAVPPQKEFVNAALRVRTDLPPRELLARMQAIEARLGRVRRERWGPRTIDLDLLWWEGGAVDEPGLRVPHPGLVDRAFALAPMLEVAPELEGQSIHGVVLGARLAQLGVPPAGEWACARRAGDRLEVHALDDADALAIGLDSALGSGCEYGDVRLIEARTASELVDRVSREALGGRGWLVIEALEKGEIRARFAFDPSYAGARSIHRLASLREGTAVITVDPCPKLL